MGLFSFFKKTDNVTKETIVASNQIDSNIESTTASEVTTKLSYHPDWEVPQEQQYIFNFLTNQLKPLKPNQLSLSTINIEENINGSWQVKAFFRSSLDHPVEFGEMELVLIDEEGKNVAVQLFDFKELGVIPAASARPWVFTFPRSAISDRSVALKQLSLSFNVVQLRGHQLDLDDSWKAQLPIEQQQQLAEVVKSMPKLAKNEVNFTGLQLKALDNGNLAASIFIRNGNDKPINLEQVPLEILDANEIQLAKGSFTLNPKLQINANTTKPWTFVFPKELVQMNDKSDLSKWTARVPKS